MIECAIMIRTFSGRWKGQPFDRVQFFKRNMESLFKNTTGVDWHCWIIDDASPMPEQVQYLAKIEGDPRVTVIRKKHNLGRQHSFCLQRKLGVESRAPWVYVCDDDYEYRPGWLRRMIDDYQILRGQFPKAGLMCGFHREGFVPDGKFEIGGRTFGLTKKWIGCRMFAPRHVFIAGGYLDEDPMPGWPTPETKQWTSPWIDDGSYQFHIVDLGFEHAFVVMDRPSLIDHIGSFGVHARPHNVVRGAK